MTRLHAAIFFAFALLGLASCASDSLLLVHPRSGATIECSGMGWGIMAPSAGGIADECVKKYEREGYVQKERLTPGERADLERRGVLPRPQPPAARTGY